MENFKEEIIKYFDFLFKLYGFVFVEDESVEKELRDLIAVAQSKEMRIRFIKDRADFFLDIGSVMEQKKWYGFYKILYWLKLNNRISENFKPLNKMKTTSMLLKQHFEVIKVLFPFEINNIKEG